MRKSKPVQLLQEWSIPLISGVVGALLWANGNHESYHRFLHFAPFGEASHLNFHFLVNDIFMALFFGIAAKEIAEATLPGGKLYPLRTAVNPLLGTAGGVLGPIGVFFIWMWLTGDWSIRSAWAVPTATDIALAWLVARAVFGAGHPAVTFLVLLAVADDGIGLAIIAIFYPDPVNPVRPVFIGLIVLAMIAAYLLKRYGVRNFWAYLLAPGVISWCGFFLAHLHPALALVPVVPFMPHASRDHGMFVDWDGPDTMSHFEHTFKFPVDMGLFAFGIANAGVVFSSVGNGTWGVLFALIIGKTVGVFSFSAIGHALGFRLPPGMDFRSLLAAGVTAGMGLTVALFVAGVAMPAGPVQDALKMGALGSAAAAPMAIMLGRALGIRRVTASPKKQAASAGVPEPA